jgi:type II secretory pathway pseudopilin PulG
MIRPTSTSSFTLVELLVVIGILAILTAAVVIVLNPAELLKQGRDSKRTTDLANLNNAIKLLLTQNPDVNLGAASTVYISLADSSSTCGSYSLPSLPTGWKYQCATAANYQKIDGAGWVPVNFSSANNVASLPTLPTDPQNAGLYYYSYIPGGSWEITSLFESRKYAAKAQADAGSDPERLEIGSNLALWNNAYGLVGYWPFEEGSGTSSKDMSGNNNHGSWFGTGIHYAAGKVGQWAGQFNGANNDYLQLNAALSMNMQSFSFTTWFKNIATGDQKILATGTSYCILQTFGGNMRVCMNSCDVGTKPVSDSTWHFAAVVADGVSTKVYIDGNTVPDVTQLPLPTTISHVLRFGAVGGGPSGTDLPTYYFYGLIDDARIYKRPLSQAEIQAIYNATK